MKGFRPNAKVIGKIYSVGIPSIIMASIGSVMTFGMNKILISFTSTATAVFGVYFKLQSFVFMPIFGLNNGMVPIISYNYGARKPDRMMKTIKLSILYATVIMLIGVAVFMLIPDKLDDDEASALNKYGPFLTTLIAFFLAEMGDKTQIATVMLAAQYPHFVMVVIGTTLGMLIANVPVVLAGNFAADRLPLTLIRRLAALAFAVLAVYAACQALGLTGTL